MDWQPLFAKGRHYPGKALRIRSRPNWQIAIAWDWFSCTLPAIRLMQDCASIPRAGKTPPRPSHTRIAASPTMSGRMGAISRPSPPAGKASRSASSAFVFDLMEPHRPLVDRRILEFVKGHVFHSADFIIRSDGVCRLNPEMARCVVGLAGTAYDCYNCNPWVHGCCKGGAHKWRSSWIRQLLQRLRLPLRCLTWPNSERRQRSLPLAASARPFRSG
jgi:CRISPR associated protein Cas1